MSSRCTVHNATPLNFLPQGGLLSLSGRMQNRDRANASIIRNHNSPDGRMTLDYIVHAPTVNVFYLLELAEPCFCETSHCSNSVSGVALCVDENTMLFASYNVWWGRRQPSPTWLSSTWLSSTWMPSTAGDASASVSATAAVAALADAALSAEPLVLCLFWGFHSHS